MLWKKDGSLIVCGDCRSVKMESGQYLPLEQMEDMDKNEFLTKWDKDDVRFVQCSACFRKKRRDNIGDECCRTNMIRQVTPSSIEKEC